MRRRYIRCGDFFCDLRSFPLSVCLALLGYRRIIWTHRSSLVYSSSFFSPLVAEVVAPVRFREEKIPFIEARALAAAAAACD